MHSLESATVTPKFEVYPPGNRSYSLKDWEEVGSDSSSHLLNMNSYDLMQLGAEKVYPSGEIPVVNQIYLAIKDFNPNDIDPTLTKEHVNLLSFKTGELLLVTLAPNKAGWFEGYRANDPDCVCGIAHKDAIKKLHFS